MALRQQVWVDRSVQGVLVGRVILYWVCAMLYVGIGWTCFQYNQNPEWTLAKHGQILFGQMWPWLPTAIILLPLAIYDFVRLSNLFVGPIFRLRKHFAALRQDIACAPLTFREDDYWRELAAPINDMQAEILRLRTAIIELNRVSSHTSELSANVKADTPKDPRVFELLDAENDAEMQTVTVETQPTSSAAEAEDLQPTVDETVVAITSIPADFEALPAASAATT